MPTLEGLLWFNVIFLFLDCFVNEKTGHWHEVARADDTAECKNFCEIDHKNSWQYAVHEGGRCHCLEYVELGKSVYVHQ